MQSRLLFTVSLCFIFPQQSFAQNKTDRYRPPAITTTEVPVVPPATWERLRQYQNLRAAAFRGWSPDGKGMLVQTQFGNTAQLHLVYEPGGRREQITFFDEPADGFIVPKDPDGNLLVTMSRGGSENNQIYYLEKASGKTTLLTDGKSRNSLGPVLADGSRMILANNSRNGRDTDLYISDIGDPRSSKMILQTKGEFWIPFDWSPDRFTLLINRYVSINETYPALLDIVTGKKRAIPIPEGKRTSYRAMAFSRDGKYIFASSDSRSEFQQLARIDVKTMRYSWIVADSSGEEIFWDISNIVVDRNSDLIAFTVNENGASALYIMADIEKGTTRTLFPTGDSYVLQPDVPVRVDLPIGTIGGMEFSPDSKQLGFTFSRANGPSDAFSLDLQSGKLNQWTISEVGGLDTKRFVSPTQIAYPTFDNFPGSQDPRLVPAYYFKPQNASKEKPVPVVINIHGGPESQYRPRFSSFDQFLLNELGFAVIHPNVRGSAGYGKTYLQLDNAEKREDSVKDIGALLDWIKKQPELDASQVAVVGGSYGGYMSLASLTNYSDRIKAGIDYVGIASFTTFLKNTKAYRRDLRRPEYGDERDPKMLAVFDKINPTSNAHKIKSALLVVHGMNDPRVPFSEAQQIVKKVRVNGKKVWTVYASNEGHGFRKKANRNYLTAVMVMFFSKHLKAK